MTVPFRFGLASVLALALVAPTFAQAPDSSLRPIPREPVAEASQVGQTPIARPSQIEASVPADADTDAPDMADLLSAFSAAPIAIETGETAATLAADALAALDVAPAEEPGQTDLPPPSDQITVAALPPIAGSGSTATPGIAPQPRPDLDRVVIEATALAPRASLRPDTRPTTLAPPVAEHAPQEVASTTTEPAVPQAETQVQERRGLFGGLLRPRQQVTIAGATQLAVNRSLRPSLRPDGLERTVRAAATRLTPGRVTQPGRRGALCGIPGLIGDRLEPITGRISGCGIAEPIRLREVNGITLSQPATINCDTARALQTWVERSAVPTVGRRGGGVTSLRVVASYACRTRNSQSGARLSEHARGNAIDIAGIGLANGSELTVLGGWRDRRAGPLLQSMHRGACGPFGTVLGPNSDRFHQDHFHFDVAAYRSGPYCR